MCEHALHAAVGAANEVMLASWLKDGSEKQLLSHSDICARINQAIQSRMPVRFDATIAGEMQAMLPMLVAEVMAASQLHPERADEAIAHAADQLVARIREIASEARIRRDQLTMHPAKVAARKRMGSRHRLRQSQIDLGDDVQLDDAQGGSLSDEEREHVLATAEMLMADGIVAEGVSVQGGMLRIQLPGDDPRYALVPLGDLQLIEVTRAGDLYRITHRAHPEFGLGVHYRVDRDMTLSSEAIKLITGDFYGAGDLAEKLRDDPDLLDRLWQVAEATRQWRHGSAAWLNDNESMAFYAHHTGADKMQPLVA